MDFAKKASRTLESMSPGCTVGELTVIRWAFPLPLLRLYENPSSPGPSILPPGNTGSDSASERREASSWSVGIGTPAPEDGKS